MSTRIRVFISSTMDDLANERDAVIAAIPQLNFEAVHAESWLPVGLGIWPTIERELASSHVFVLLLGTRYGWCPAEGPGARDGLSVTHMECRRARELRLPILPFMKRLRHVPASDQTPEIRKRDAFWKEVEGWGHGFWRTEFELARDLGPKVAESLAKLLDEGNLQMEVARRVRVAVPMPDEEEAPASFDIDKELIEKIGTHQAVLFAGAGMSLSAGLPSARGISEFLIGKMREAGGNPPIPSADIALQIVAGKFEKLCGRQALTKAFQSALGGLELPPTAAHRLSVRLFPLIFTSNLDVLFELACEAEGVPYDVIDEDTSITLSPGRTTIVKIDGTIRNPHRLLLTEDDYRNRVERKPVLSAALAHSLRTAPLVIAGSSLRDPTITAPLYERKVSIPGCVVSPIPALFDNMRDTGIRLKGVRADADDFMNRVATLLAVR
jgi:SIR2-like domain/Domain of unknown function (DUF4062)